MIKDVEWMTDFSNHTFTGDWSTHMEIYLKSVSLHTATQKFGLRYKCYVLIFCQNEVSTHNNSKLW